MKACIYCGEQIQDVAIKCRYCNSVLVPPADDVPSKAGVAGTVTYVFDKDLLRFAKFSGSVLALFVIVGAFLYGIDLKQAAKEIKDSQEEVRKANVDIQASKVAVQKMHEETSSLLTQARTQIGAISKSSEEARGIVATLPKYTADADVMRRQLEALLAPLLTPEQVAKLRTSSTASVVLALPTADAKRLIQADIERTTKYFAENGLGQRRLTFEIDKDKTLANAYWDGSKVVYGMGLANSENFGPYESGIVIHEATHAYFDIQFRSQSGSISEHVCDVMAVVIRGGPWTIGSVRGGKSGSPQVLRSLAAPGTAYDSPTMGKDVQVGHMKEFADGPADGGGIHINNGILNKAAYLISEGGSFGGSTVPNGIGREALGKIYVRVIQKLPSRPTWTFQEFRALVLSAAREGSLGDAGIRVIEAGFAAVGL